MAVTSRSWHAEIWLCGPPTDHPRPSEIEELSCRAEAQTDVQVEPSPAVGVAIATRNRRESILATVHRLRTLPEQPPIVVADNASSDGTAQALDGIAGVEVIPLAANCGAAARNCAVERLGTPLVAFADDDSWWEPGALRRAGQLFESFPRVALIAARILVGTQDRLDPVCVAMANSPLGHPPDDPGPAILGFVACGAIVRRSAFLAVGGFDPILRVGGEETLLSLALAAAGWRLSFAPEVVARHHPDPGARDGRQALEIRNRVLITWLRRSPMQVLAMTCHTARAAVRDGHARIALRDAARLIPQVLRKRQRLPQRIEAQLRLLEARA